MNPHLSMRYNVLALAPLPFTTNNYHYCMYIYVCTSRACMHAAPDLEVEPEVYVLYNTEVTLNCTPSDPGVPVMWTLEQMR